MEFKYTILYVDHVPTTISFYEKAFGFERKFITPEEDYAELKTGNTTLSFASHELGASNFSKNYTKSTPEQPAFGIELAFTTKNIAEDFQRAVAAGATIFEPVVKKPWGQSVGYLRDINGFLIEVCTPMSEE